VYYISYLSLVLLWRR